MSKTKVAEHPKYQYLQTMENRIDELERSIWSFNYSHDNKVSDLPKLDEFVDKLQEIKEWSSKTVATINYGINNYECPIAQKARVVVYAIGLKTGFLLDEAEELRRIVVEELWPGYDEEEKKQMLDSLNALFGDVREAYKLNSDIFRKDLILFSTESSLQAVAMIESGEVVLQPIEGDDIDKLMQTIFEEDPEKTWSDSRLEKEFAARGYKTTRQTISARSLYKAYRKEIPKRIKEIRLGRMQIDTEGKAHFSPDKKASDCYDNE